MWRTNRTLELIGAATLAWIIWTSPPQLFRQSIWTAVVVVVIVVDGFWQAITRPLPNVAKSILNRAWRVATHPLASMVILFGLLGIAYWTSNRGYLLALGIAMILLVPLRLGWEGLLRSPASGRGRAAANDLMASLEVFEGVPRPGPDGPGVVELPFQGTSRNTFVLFHGPSLRDVRVEFDAALKPNALLNVVLRYDTELKSGYMLRLDSRSNAFDAILVMREGAWGAELHRSQYLTPADTWVHVIASAQGLRLRLTRDGEVVSTAEEGTFSEGRVGFFSEVADAAIRNVVVS